MTRLRLVGRNEGLPAYQLPLGAMLEHHAWFPMNPARVLTSSFLLNVPEHLQGYALRLYFYAMTNGDPVGTLPANANELGAIFNRNHHPNNCDELRTACLWDWTEHVCRTEDGSRETIRLAHPWWTKIACEAWERAQRKPQINQERTAQQHVRRVRGHLQRLHGTRFAEKPGLAERIAETLKADGRRITLDSVREQAERLSMPTEAELKPTEAN